MAQKIKEQLNGALATALTALAGDRIDSIDLSRCEFGPSREPELGDFATSAPLVCTKILGRPPFDIATDLAAALADHPLIASATAARPGFVNIRLSLVAFSDLLTTMDIQGNQFGHVDVGGGESVLLEYVSANPTGPMHLGHCRHAASGDALARILAAGNYAVTREFYINDAGVQMKALGESFRARCLEALGLPFDAETVQYPGEYLADFAKDFVANKCKEEIEGMDVAAFAMEGRDRNLEQIKSDLAAAGVTFDVYQSEKELHDSGVVATTLDRLVTSGSTYENDGALWLRTQDHGDNEDRVLRKGDGSVTYLVPDLAYHDHKFRRGFDHYINIFGADHAGYPPRLRAGIAALGHDEKKLEVLLLRLVFLTRGGQRVKFSKRAGNFVAMADVVLEAGSDATRWFILSRSMDSEFEFDMDLAQEQSSKNPVFKVQYAHARICSIEIRAREEGIAPLDDAVEAARLLDSTIEREILLLLGRLPEIVERSVRERALHHLPAYLLSVADAWNRYYSLAKTDASYRILAPENRALAPARLRMADAIRLVLANGLALLGITAPHSMARAEDEE